MKPGRRLSLIALIAALCAADLACGGGGPGNGPTPPVVVSLSFGARTTISYGQTSTGTVTLSGNAPPSPPAFNVMLLSTDPVGAPVNSPLTVMPGTSSAAFTVTAGIVSNVEMVTITATTGSTSVSAVLTIEPPLTASPASLALDSAFVDCATATPPPALPGSCPSQMTTLTNASNFSLTISGIPAPSSGQFSATNNCPAVLPPNAGVNSSCVITVTFNPTHGRLINDNVAVSYTVNGNSPPSFLIPLSGTGQHWVGLTWMASPTSGVGYNVYRQTQVGGACQTPSSATYSKVNSAPISTTSFADTDPSLIGSTTYCYSVTAVDSGGESAFINPAVQTTTKP